jgi:hypothetical protein
MQSWLTLLNTPPTTAIDEFANLAPLHRRSNVEASLRTRALFQPAPNSYPPSLSGSTTAPPYPPPYVYPPYPYPPPPTGSIGAPLSYPYPPPTYRYPPYPYPPPPFGSTDAPPSYPYSTPNVTHSGSGDNSCGGENTSNTTTMSAQGPFHCEHG